MATARRTRATSTAPASPAARPGCTRLGRVLDFDPKEQIWDCRRTDG